MKNLEEIEAISFEELERAADDLSVKVPRGVEESAKRGVMAAAMAEALRKRPNHVRTALCLAAAAAACAVAVTAIPGKPEDTFTNPEIAYLQVEKTMSFIAQKMDFGLAIAENAPDPVEKMNGIIEKINR